MSPSAGVAAGPGHVAQREPGAGGGVDPAEGQEPAVDGDEAGVGPGSAAASRAICFSSFSGSHSSSLSWKAIQVPRRLGGAEVARARRRRG